ncbi:enoyl-CoA hydratase/isomerase family protein [Agrobacterium deltaense]|uniref:enoyl-CoA hydratase/isomerase family protein n=1 Tax=Agrobacterium deltaense TaxID=1183412 RepID=UPI003FD64066
MGEIDIRIEGRIGRITLTRPKALNALTHGMCLAIETALDQWRDDRAVALVLIDAEGEKAFCAGGDIAELYRTARSGNYEFGRRFWRDEYRMNAKLAEYPKPIASLMQGFVMGGGVGVGCHVSHRVVCETSRVAMPECGIGLIPDVGATRVLAAAPGRLGRYIALTGSRLGPADAIHAGFADLFVPCERWGELTRTLAETGDLGVLQAAAANPGPAPLAKACAEIDTLFIGDSVADILARLGAAEGDLAVSSLHTIGKASPLALASALAILNAYQGGGIRAALTLEYRFTHRSCEQSDFLEGVRAAIIDKDRAPKWRHGSAVELGEGEASAMLAPLGAEELTFDQEETA